MRACTRLAVFLVVSCLSLGTSQAGPVVEAWRSPLGTMRGLSVNPNDGSCWAASGSRVIHLGSDGALLSQTANLSSVASVSVNPSDGSCWAADPALRQAVHLRPDGTELWRGGDFGEWSPRSISTSPHDGSCWAVGLDGAVVHLSSTGEELWRGGGGEPVAASAIDDSWWALDSYRAEVVHLDEGGNVLSRTGGFELYSLLALSVSAADGSVWVTDHDEVAHLSANGTQLWRGGGFTLALSVSVDARDGSCWVADTGAWDANLGEWTGSSVVHLAADGTELWRGGDVGSATVVAASGFDGSCWVGDGVTNEIVHLSATGLELWRSGKGYPQPRGIAATEAGGCWVGYGWGRGGRVARLTSDGSPLWQGGLFWSPVAISVDPVGGSAWVADCGNYGSGPEALGEVVHLSAEGQMLWRGGDVLSPMSVSVNPTDHSCWVADYGTDQVIHVDRDGRELWRGAGEAQGVAANPEDGSCWVAGYFSVRHLAADGSELWRGSNFDNPKAVAVDPRDGSCWVADAGHGQVVLLAPDGTELWRKDGVGWAESLSVDPASGLCWLGPIGEGTVVVLGRAGAVVWRQSGFHHASALSVDRDDGSCWVADTENGEITRFITPHRLFGDVPFDSWAQPSIYACVAAGIAAGYPDWLYHPSESLTRAQMAVYIARSLATPTGETGVPEPDVVAPTFTDVLADHWAYRHIEYCAAQGIVEGYPGGSYHPDEVANRGQMAVYIARSVATPAGDAGVPEVPAGAAPTFADVTADNDWAWCDKHVEYCAAEGIVQGYWDGHYHPEREVTRDQMAVYVARAFGLPF